MGDELSYKSMAQKFHQAGDFYAPGLTGVSMGFSNVLYQFLISHAFYFESFYFAIKAINAVVINLAIFPVYALVRKFQSDNTALMIAGLIAMMPYNSISMFVMAENLYVPVFWASLFFLFECFTRESLRDGVISGVFLGLLFLTKPQAVSLALAFAFAFVVALLFSRRLNSRFSMLLASGVALAGSAVLVFFAGNYLFSGQGEAGSVVGSHYTSTMERPSLVDYFSESFLRMSFAHAGFALILFGLPVMHLVYQSIRAFQAKDRSRFLLVVVAMTAFGAAFAMALVFTQSISHIENNMRLHARYYSFVFPVFLITLVALPADLPRFRGARVALVGSFLAIVIGAILAYRSFPSNAFGIDYADWAWLNIRFFDKRKFYIIGIIAAVPGAFACLLSVRRLKIAKQAFLLFYAIFFIVSNYGQAWNTLKSIQLFHSGLATERKMITDTIADHSGQVLLVENGFVRRCNYVFWLPYAYTGVMERSSDTPIDQNEIPGGTEWVILIGDHEANFSYKRLHHYPPVRLFQL